MNVFNSKYFVFIISAGRTGTRFLGEDLSKMIEDSFSVHEPDVITLKKGYNLIDKLLNFGLYQVVLGKILGKTGIRNLSQNYVSGQLDLSQLIQKIKKHRQKFYEKIKEELIVESYSGWFGCIDAIKELYENYKIVIITRDPRDWITSVINWGSLYGKNDWLSHLGISRLNPKLINDKEYINVWDNFTRFEKLCWTYKTYYEIMIKESRGLKTVKLFKFEDLFSSENYYEQWPIFLRFITSFDNKCFNFRIFDSLLKKKSHFSKRNIFPKYDEWEKRHKKTLKRICNDISNRLGYKL